MPDPQLWTARKSDTYSHLIRSSFHPMSNHPISMEASFSSCDPPRPSSKPESYQAGYQQALDDFAIPLLLYRLQTYSDANFDAAATSPATSTSTLLINLKK